MQFQPRVRTVAPATDSKVRNHLSHSKPIFIVTSVVVVPVNFILSNFTVHWHFDAVLGIVLEWFDAAKQ